MDYLVLECSDSANLSERVFWEKIVGFKGEIKFSGGNTHINKIIDEIALTRGDNLCIFIDTINLFENEKKLADIMSILTRKFRKLMQNGINVYLNKDLSFESMLLRLKCLQVAWQTGVCFGDKCFDVAAEDLKKLQIDLQRSYKGLSRNSRNVVFSDLNNIMHLINGKTNTSEHIMASLLQNITYNSGFCIKKGELGYCWTSDCEVDNVGIVTYLKDGKNETCRMVNTEKCYFCRNLFCEKRNIILSELCDSNWHALFYKFKSFKGG